jgi:aspartyl-tRNA(Asn)/glutamyl-tRNA(Gln) amidotransferase subunit C
MPKVKVDRALLLKVAANARLKLTDAEIKKFLPQLQEMLNVFSKLDELKVDKEKPSFQPTELSNVMREDKVKECLTQEQAFANTKHKENGYFKGPKVV